MPRTRASGAAVAVAACVGLLAGCGDDGGSGATTSATATTTLDPGVTFPEDVTVPPDEGEVGTTTTVPDPSEGVESHPGEVPSEFPADFPVPEGAQVEIGTIGRVEGELRLSVDYTVADEEPLAVLDFYRDAIEDAGFVVLLDEADGEGQDLIGQLVFETDRYVGNVLVSGDGGTGVLLSLTATMPE